MHYFRVSALNYFIACRVKLNELLRVGWAALLNQPSRGGILKQGWQRNCFNYYMQLLYATSPFGTMIVFQDAYRIAGRRLFSFFWCSHRGCSHRGWTHVCKTGEKSSSVYVGQDPGSVAQSVLFLETITPLQVCVWVLNKH